MDEMKDLQRKHDPACGCRDCIGTVERGADDECEREGCTRPPAYPGAVYCGAACSAQRRDRKGANDGRQHDPACGCPDCIGRARRGLRRG